MQFNKLVAGSSLVGGIALGVALLGPASLAGPARAATAPVWVTTTGTTVNLTLIAGWDTSNAGYNFNGAAHGQMVVTVPQGDKVVVAFTNKVSTPHNFDIIPYTQPLPGHGVQPAFIGANSPLPQFKPGPLAAPKPQTVTFVADKAGTYMVVCGVAGHALAGMWDSFVVSPTAKAASVAFNKAGVASAPEVSAPPATIPTWVTTAGKVVHLILISGWNNANAGFNFNGGAYGHIVVTVPLGATVDAVYKNAVPIFHDVDIIDYQKPLPSHSATPAFAGARSPLPSFKPGAPPPSNGPKAFSFVASKAGTYMIICGVPGHALAGMWDTLVVSPTATAASMTFK